MIELDKCNAKIQSYAFTYNLVVHLLLFNMYDPTIQSENMAMILVVTYATRKGLSTTQLNSTQLSSSAARHLLPTGSEEREVLGVGSIPVPILPSCQYMKMLYHNCIDINIVG